MCEEHVLVITTLLKVRTQSSLFYHALVYVSVLRASCLPYLTYMSAYLHYLFR